MSTPTMHRRARLERAGALVRRPFLRRPAARDEQLLRELLRLAANTVDPADGLERIRMKTNGGAPLAGSAATDDDLGSPVVTSIPKPARAVRPGDTIVRHPDHPERHVRYRVIAGAREISGGGVLIDYTAPAEELPGCTPNDRASGVLVLGVDQPCEIETVPAQNLPGGNR